MALEQDIGRLIDSTDRLTETVDGKISQITTTLNQKSQEIDSKLSAKEQAVDAKIASFQKALPLAPNNLSDTKLFSKINADHPEGTAVDVMQSHGAPWSCFYYNGSQGNSTVTKLTNKMLADYGLSPNAGFHRALGDFRSDSETYYGSDFRVLLFDVEITQGMATDENYGRLYLLNQGCPTFTGWGRGEFLTQASCWVNVLEHSGRLTFHPSSNRSANITAGANDAGKGWQYKHAVRQGWGGCHQPFFGGIGKMKVAVALPYVGTGDHGDNFIWADSVGHPYSHTGPANEEGA
ncbi:MULTISPECIES: hypothetical protein [Pseudoalteromonas]|uniref:Uncharacterized protein n=1 Tax=Pseudoalteromonas amylolytica TaxID=1859457 RepID=A0A1S1MRK2_9GAMM|nr:MULTISPECIES: hypothetical protein [Pseudoalteromonas]OHU87810.1 hypothetical protein BFC16_10370 [Pseudoalteromonas sp. JW3]OHU91250.1 hypothetical protein BET10_10490 [Pseudoalteromonas amylolytica]